MLWVLPVCTEALVGDTETAIVVAPAITVTCAVSITVDCACEIAVMVIVAGEGIAAGAVYVPFASMVPCVVSPPATPFTCHVTAVLGVFATAAVNFSVVETCTEALVGATDIVTPCGPGLTEDDCTLPHPHAVKTIRKNIPMDSFSPNGRKVREAMYSFLPRQTDIAFLFRRNRNKSLAAAG